MQTPTFYRAEIIFCQEAITITKAIIEQHKENFAASFYNHMLDNTEAAHFLSPEVIQAHLKPGLQVWLEKVFSVADEDSLNKMLAIQRHVGEVHARIEIPIGLVTQGFRLLKHKIHDELLKTDASTSLILAAVLRIETLLDIALEEMSHAFIASHTKNARIDEAYKIVAAGQNLSLEKERQVSALLEWENKLFRALTTNQTLNHVTKLSESAFGLWLHHKASLLFDQTNESKKIDLLIAKIDNETLPSLIGSNEEHTQNQTQTIRQLVSDIEQITYLLSTIFDRFIGLEVGKDAMTQLFNRRFLSTILRHEIELHRKRKDEFAVLMIDIDHFKQINDLHGHDMGDKVIQHVATTLISQVRAGDFVFRYGGEEFLVLLTEITPHQALAIAEKLRHKIAHTPISLADPLPVHLSVSVGLAQYDGHPDYQRLISRADAALYEAKEAGRNRCVVAS
ncbi:GGDEF domain-containing protein [Leeia sp. TBRC 13508]|uniref:Diguanylate cyclase DosC n=1 Tax=Leeia speluncae TaxID=2884804 RepID=A0ABS8D4K9_9NEIS|nr:GGDEF domain-containing protein [Leeia speluncae]MCB6183135.1 GGDEF domain-containing protein [Leeia speluncae]